MDDAEPNEFVWVTDDDGDRTEPPISHETVESQSRPGKSTDGTAIEMEIPDGLAEEIIGMYGDLDAEFYQRYGEHLEPNKLFWEHGVQILLENEEELRDRIGLRHR